MANAWDYVKSAGSHVGNFVKNEWSDFTNQLSGVHNFTKGLFSDPVGSWDRFRNGRTNEVNEQIAQENLQYQRENLEYQKALQQQIFEREDSAYARTAQDMRNAGMSPIIMNGTNGAGEAIQTDALHNDFQYQDRGSLEAFTSLFNTANSIYKSYQDTQFNNARISALQSQTKGQDVTNEFLPFSLGAGLIGQILQNQNLSQDIKNKVADRGLTMLKTLEQSYRNSDLKRWNEWATQFGISQNMTDKERYAQFAKALLKNMDVKDENLNDASASLFNLGDSVSPEDVIKSKEFLKRNYSDHGLKFWLWDFD